MNVQKLETLPPPPGVFNSLKAGFDVVSSRAGLILLPSVLDIFLWLGPRLSVGNIYSALFAEWLDFSRKADFPVQNVQVLKEGVEMFGHINILNVMRTFPIGIPSLFSGNLPDTLPLQTPIGIQSVIQVSSILGMFGWIVLLTIVGWIGGGLYFRWVSESTLGAEDAGINPMRAIIQTFILSLACVIGLMVILFPVLMVLSFLALISSALANGAVFIIMLLSFWLIVPLFFMPHGIFTRKQNAFHSVLTSLKMARFTLPTSSLFVFSVFVLSTGLNSLWSVPSNNSWMMLVGIGGHAFVTTALLSASFVYYREMNNWLQTMSERFRQAGQSSIAQK